MKHFFRSILIIAGVALPLVSMAAESQRRYVVIGASDTRPFSQGVVSGNTLYVSGSLGLDPKTGQAPPDLKLEIKLVMDSVKAVIDQAGFKMDDFVNVQIFCTDLSLYDAFNEVYVKYFNKNLPARSFIGADKLLRGAHFEVMGIAIKDSK